MPIDSALGSLGLRPGVCTSSSRPAAPYAGQMIYETNTFRTLQWDGTGWVVLSEPYQSYVPRLDQTTANISKSITHARFKRSDGWVTGNTHLTLAGAGTSGGVLVMSPPVAPFISTSAIIPVGDFYLFDNPTAQYSGTVVLRSGEFAFLRSDTTFTNYFGTDPTFALASGDVISINYSYEMLTRYS